MYLSCQIMYSKVGVYVPRASMYVSKHCDSVKTKQILTVHVFNEGLHDLLHCSILFIHSVQQNEQGMKKKTRTTTWANCLNLLDQKSSLQHQKLFDSTQDCAFLFHQKFQPAVVGLAQRSSPSEWPSHRSGVRRIENAPSSCFLSSSFQKFSSVFFSILPGWGEAAGARSRLFHSATAQLQGHLSLEHPSEHLQNPN